MNGFRFPFDFNLQRDDSSRGQTDFAGTIVCPWFFSMKGSGETVVKDVQPHALQMQLLPARSGGILTGLDLAVLVFLADPGTVPPSRARILEELYQLTPVEARLADLFLQGQELKQAAEELKLTYANIRCHLKQIFRKTNTTRQTELLRLLLSIPV